MPTGRLQIPTGSLAHLTAAEVAAAWELGALARLLEAGLAWHGLALPGSFEERFYRLNSLPRRLIALYHGLDPADPDEDIVEEAEPRAVALVADHYLLDESVDLLYDSITWSGTTVVRRAGGERRREAGGKRGALLAVKRTYQDDWTTDAVMARLAATRALGLEARPVLLTTGPEIPDEALSRRATAVLGRAVVAHVGPGGGLVRLAPA